LDWDPGDAFAYRCSHAHMVCHIQDRQNEIFHHDGRSAGRLTGSLEVSF
jgi:hypothetical protein